MFRRSVAFVPSARVQLRRYTTGSTASTSVFPKLEEITAEDIGSSSVLDKRLEKGKGKYHLQRSAYGNLPIYIEYKDNNNVHTEIRKVTGDVVSLRNDLVEILDYVPKKNFKVLAESNKLLIKGNHKEHLQEIFEDVF